MKNEENKHWIVEQVEKNLFTILVGGALIYSSFTDADINTSREIAQINQKLEKLDAIYARVCRLEANAQLGECK